MNIRSTGFQCFFVYIDKALDNGMTHVGVPASKWATAVCVFPTNTHIGNNKPYGQL